MASNLDLEEDSDSEDLMDQWRQKQSQTAEELRDLVKKGENYKLRKMVNPQNCDSRSAKNDSTALIAATHIGNIEAAQILLDAGADPNLARSDGINPLIMATSSDKKHSAEKAASMVESLLQRGADPFARDINGKNALYWAMKRAYTEAAKRIVHAIKNSSRSRDDQERIAMRQMGSQSRQQYQIAERLCGYVRNNENRKMKQELEEQNRNYRCGEYGETALIVATSVGNSEAMQILLEAGADPNRARSDGVTPLIMATRNKNNLPDAKIAAMVGALLQKGAKPSARECNGSGANALHWATKGKYDQTARLLAEAMDRHSDWNKMAKQEMEQQTQTEKLEAKRLHSLVREGNLDQLLTKANDKNCNCRFGENADTLLMTAAMSDSNRAPQIMNLLLRLGASEEKRNKMGFSALHCAAAKSKDVAVKLLAKKSGFLIKSVDNIGATPLIIATDCVSSPSAEAVAKVVDTLLRNGADPAARRDDGRDALFFAKKYGCHEAKNLLIGSKYQQTNYEDNPEPLESRVDALKDEMMGLAGRLDQTNRNFELFAVDTNRRINGIEGKVGELTRGQAEQNLENKRGQYYPVSPKPGTCLIINVNNYTGDREWIRKGSELDEKKIEEVFSELQFKVEFCRDPTGAKIYEVIHDYAKSAPQDDMFVCFIMGHGANAGVYGKDWKLQTFHDIVGPLRPVNCPSLKDKPKIFFVQACRSSHDSSSASSDFSSGGPRYTPQDADFQFTYATTENNVALRIPNKGSPFVMSVCEAVKANSGSLSLHDILLQVQSDLKNTGRKMRTEDGYEYGMVSETHQTLSFNVALSHRLPLKNNRR